MKHGTILAAIAALSVASAGHALAQANSPPSAQPNYTPEQIEALKRQRDQALATNALIGQANAAMTAKDWQAAVDPLKQLIAAYPDNWVYLSALGDAELNLGRYSEALDAYANGTGAIDKLIATGKTDLKPAKAHMLVNAGNAALKLHRTQDAVAFFTRAAAIDPNPATAWFNLCATAYNVGDVDGALAACDKAIAADPNKADAYFIKGSLLLGNSTADQNKVLHAPPGCAEALRKYLELVPNGPHAEDVRQMLAVIGSTVK
jgi:tetratricopeptide (TPR) repeat protein